jgi:hypothetical protein
LQIFKDGSTHPDTIVSHHRKPIDNLDLVEHKWNAVMRAVSEKGARKTNCEATGESAVVWSKDSISNIAEADTQWKTFFHEQRSFWDGVDENDIEQCRPNGGDMQFIDIQFCHSSKRPNVSCSYPSLEEEVTRDERYERGKPFLDWLDNTTLCSRLRPHQLESFPERLQTGLKEIIFFENRVGATLFKIYASKPLHVHHSNDKAITREVYDVTKHLTVGDVALIDMSEGREDCINSGVELGRVTKIYEHPTRAGVVLVNVTYMVPNGVELDENFECVEDWPDEWVHKKIITWKVRDESGRVIPYNAHGIPIESIAWSCGLTQDGFFRKKSKHPQVMLAQFKRLQAHIKTKSFVGQGAYRTDELVFGDTLEDDDDI